MSIDHDEEPSFFPAGPSLRRAPSRAPRVRVCMLSEVLHRELAALHDQLAEDARQYGTLGRALTACRALRDATTPAEHAAAMVLACSVADEAGELEVRGG